MNYLNTPQHSEMADQLGFYQQSAMQENQARMYGSFAEGAPLPPGAAAAMYEAYDFDMMDGYDQSDPKRRRIARACDMCRKKKIKCDGKMPACTHCQNYKTECVFTQVEKKRNPPKGAKYIEGLENRLGRMESLLRLSGIITEEDTDSTDLGQLEKKLQDRTRERELAGSESEAATGGAGRAGSSTPPARSRRRRDSSPESSDGTPDPTGKKGGKEDVEQLSDMMCSLVTNNVGETRYIGSSSGFSIFSPKGIQWVNEKTGDRSFQDMITAQAVDDNKWIQWKPDVFRDIFVRKVYLPLPSRAEAVSLLKDFFENFNCMFPLFHEPTFMHLVDKHYSRDPYEGSGWWASLNVALAIAHRLRVMSNLVPAEEDQKAWGYLKNAMAVQTELTFRNTDLLSVQALLGMALFLQGTPNPQPSFFLVAAAIRLSHSIGLHKRGSGFGLNASEIEQRNRVFWIAYMLDRDLCLRSGRPPIQDDDDMNVELPSEDPPDNIGNIPLADGKNKVNLFRLMSAFAVIASKVYKQLYSVKASKQTDGELLNTIGELDRELEEWKNSIPIDFRPEHEIKASHTPLILHVVVLHFAYYNCLTTIHRMSVHHGYWTSRLSNYAIQGLNARPLNPRVFSSAALCVSAARASIHLIKYIPQGDFDCVWLILYYPISALVTLFANILQNPQDGRARSDLKLMNHVIDFLSLLCADEQNRSVRRMLNISTEFERIAKIVLDKTDKESRSRRKKRQAEKDPADDRKEMTSPIDGTYATPIHDPLTPQPTQPGNIPKVYTPPSVGNVLSSENFANLANIANELDPATRDWLSPQLQNMAIPPNGRTGMTPGASPFPLSPGSTYTNGPPHPAMAGASMSQALASDFSSINNGVFSGPSGAGAMADPMSGMGNQFGHPFVPQDTWSMPFSFEWDWADMTGQSHGGAGAGPAGAGNAEGMRTFSGGFQNSYDQNR